MLRTVTLPLMAPVLLLLATRDTAIALQASFTVTYLLTDGGPDRATLYSSRSTRSTWASSSCGTATPAP